MAKFKIIPILAITAGLYLAPSLRAQNPPMNCSPDGIIEVCTLVDTNAAPPPVVPVAPPAPVVPHVAYSNGKLTITAENVPLSDVLSEISRKTGAAIDIPGGTASERVFVNIGPSSVRDALVSLLNGTRFNYVMLGSENTADKLQKIVLTPADQTSEVAQNSPSVQSQAPPPPTAAPIRPDEAPSPAVEQDIEMARQEVLQRLMAEHQEQMQQGGNQSGRQPQAPAGASSEPAPGGAPAPAQLSPE